MQYIHLHMEVTVVSRSGESKDNKITEEVHLQLEPYSRKTKELTASSIKLVFTDPQMHGQIIPGQRFFLTIAPDSRA